MKTTPLFYFVDGRQLCTTDTRENTARLLRSYRAQPDVYRIERGSAGEHRISLGYPGSPVAAIFTR